jgi:class 3 adenylate cyclase
MQLSAVFAFLTAASVFWAGGAGWKADQRASEQELTILCQKIGHAFVAADGHQDGAPSARGLDDALSDAIRHPRVASAWVHSGRTDFHLKQKENGFSAPAVREVRREILDGRQRPIAEVVLAVSDPDARLFSPFWGGIFLRALVAGAVAFCLPLLFVRRSDPFLAKLLAAVEDVAAGRLDVALSAGDDAPRAELTDAFNRMVEGIRERDRMRHSLGRIMDPKIAEILIKEDPRVGGLRRESTILFCDIRNYTALCEQMTVDELQEFLNEYWKDTVDIIMEQDGTIDKFHGDGVCVVFGAPALRPDDPLRAVRTAWRLVANAEKMNARRQALRKPPIQIGVGIHLGEVIAGHIGSERRMDYTVVGDVVNVAARIEELNKKFGTKILISDSVYERVETFVTVKTITLAHLRGHKRPILVHTLLDFVDEDRQKKVA